MSAPKDWDTTYRELLLARGFSPPATLEAPEYERTAQREIEKRARAEVRAAERLVRARSRVLNEK